MLGEARRFPPRGGTVGGATTPLKVACTAPHRTDMGKCASCGSPFISMLIGASWLQDVLEINAHRLSERAAAAGSKAPAGHQRLGDCTNEHYKGYNTKCIAFCGGFNDPQHVYTGT